MGQDRLHIAVITCRVLETEIDHYAAAAPNVIHVHKLEQGLHNDPPKLRCELQAAIEQVEREQPDADAIVLGYGLCSRGVEGVTTTRCQLVVPRAHDCITLLLGSRKRYADYVAQHPGTYWYSPGWNRCHTPPGKQRYDKLHAKYVQQFGEEDAAYLMEQEQSWFSHYNRATYVHLTVGATEQDRQYTRDCADWLGWRYDEQQGDPALLQALLSGDWNDEDFLVLNPGQTLTMTADHRVIEPADASSPAASERAADTTSPSPSGRGPGREQDHHG